MSATAASAEQSGPSGLRRFGSGLQRLGRSLMLPIATLPAAALLLRLGQPDMLGRWEWSETPAAVIAAAGNAIIANLPLIFAVGIAIGWARRADGSTALAAVIGYLVLEGVYEAMSPVVLEGDEMINFGVLGGIVTGIVSAILWQRYHRTQLPTYLGFFSGRRLVPMLAAFAMLVIGVLSSFLYPAFDAALSWLGETVTENDVIGGFVFGTANRLLIPLGLHHILNSFPWFQLGEFEANGEVFQGDIARFLNGDPTAGIFMTGFFPIMMFALPAAALAIWRTARPENRKVVGGIMFSVAFTSFLTGITEPLEFAFIFVAWPLFLIHALLTGTSLAICNALDIHAGFGFSAGFIDYALNFTIAQRPVLLLLVGAVYAVVYYFLFTFIIRKWKLRTPGREEEGETADVAATPASRPANGGTAPSSRPADGDTSPSSRPVDGETSP